MDNRAGEMQVFLRVVELDDSARGQGRLGEVARQHGVFCPGM